MPDDAKSNEIVDLAYRGMRPEDRIGFFMLNCFRMALIEVVAFYRRIGRMLYELSGLRPINQGQPCIDSLPYSIRSRPFICQAESRKKQQRSDQGTHVVVQLPE